MKKYNLNQLKVLRQYFDDDNIYIFLEMVNPSCSCFELEILAKAFKMGVDIKDLCNCHVSPDCLILLCDAKMRGIDVRGLTNEFVDVDLLKQLISIKSKNLNADMTFIEDLSLSECIRLVDDYRLYGVGVLDRYRRNLQINKKMIEAELDYIFHDKNK